jgi:hypothetical protein
LRRRLVQRGEIEQALILLVSDHGSSAVHTHLDLADWFRAQGVPTLAHPIVWERKPNAAVMVAGNGSAMVYARPGDSRTARWPIERLRKNEAFGSDRNLLDALRHEPSVAFIAAESEQGGVWVESKTGAARITTQAGEICYQPLTGDPLGLGGPQSASSRDWLEATWAAEYPDAPFHLLDQFRSSRAGDLLVIGQEGYDFRARYEFPEHRWGHGSLTRSHMQTPLWSSHKIPAAPLRTVDIFPAMVDWLGVPLPEGTDGQPVWLPLRQRAEEQRSRVGAMVTS